MSEFIEKPWKELNKKETNHEKKEQIKVLTDKEFKNDLEARDAYDGSRQKLITCLNNCSNTLQDLEHYLYRLSVLPNWQKHVLNLQKQIKTVYAQIEPKFKDTIKSVNIPKQFLSPEKQTNFVSESKSLPNSATADTIFSNAKNKLLNINNWSSAWSGNFTLLWKDWKPKKTNPEVWDLIEIHVAWSLSAADLTWLSKVHVKVEKINDSEDEISITVRPCAAPWDNVDDINHFYTKNSTNTFMLSKEINAIWMPIIAFHTHWRNLELNWIQWVAWWWGEVSWWNKAQRFDLWTHVLGNALKEHKDLDDK